MGHEIFLLSGEFERDILNKNHQEVLGDFSLLSDENWQEQEKAFINPDKNPDEILNHIEEKSERITNRIIEWIEEKNIDIFISENASALPFNLSMTIGIKKAVRKTGIRTITHDHDFYWERGDRYISCHEEINKIVRETIPLNLPNVVNVVINTSMNKVLEEEYNISKTIIVPNVMDFKKRSGNVVCESSFLRMFGLNKEDIILLQPTRVIKRKGIETAIKLVHKLNDKRIKLLITGRDKDEVNGKRIYYKKLLSLVKELGLEKQVIFANDKFSANLLSKAYSCANSCTYFSDYEGFKCLYRGCFFQETNFC